MFRNLLLFFVTLYLSLQTPSIAKKWDGWDLHALYKEKYECPTFEKDVVSGVVVHNRSVYKDRIIPGEYPFYFNLNVKEELAKDTTIRSEFLFKNTWGIYRMTFEKSLCDLALDYNDQYCNAIWEKSSNTCPCPPTQRDWVTWTDGLVVNFPLPESTVFEEDCELDLRVYLESAETDHEDVRRIYGCTGFKMDLKWIETANAGA
ncbi:unnamed protein product [Cyprideis torosa]|uniref:Uncharacterized protein n=1 Tax=Cyprideis torosa TaxID=163714 RepID=A0A7R8W5I7_9CRUS|nr:unnamed protein product [Cyprideis torosa]CAG0885353.1 unnamed protein product [Cyprideis torosa]